MSVGLPRGWVCGRCGVDLNYLRQYFIPNIILLDAGGNENDYLACGVARSSELMQHALWANVDRSCGAYLFEIDVAVTICEQQRTQERIRKSSVEGMLVNQMQGRGQGPQGWP